MGKNGTILYNTIGKNIKELRKARNLGQEDLAERISLSRSSVSNIEIGKHQPSMYTIYEIAIALDCKITELVPTVENYKNLCFPIDDKYEDIFNSLPENISKKNLSILKETLRKND